MRCEEIDVSSSDVDGCLRNRSGVAQVTRADSDEAVLRENQVTLGNTGRLGYEMRIPRATGFLVQRRYQRWNAVRRHFAKRDQIGVHTRKPGRDPIIVGNTVRALSELNVPAKHTQRHARCLYGVFCKTCYSKKAQNNS